MANFSNKISVLIDVTVDKAAASLHNFRGKLDDAEGAGGKMKAGLSSAFGAIQENAGALALSAGTALVAFGVKSVAAFNDLALEAGKLADATGQPVEQMSRWIEVADDVGISVGDLQGAFIKFEKAAGSGALKDYNDELVRTKDGAVDASASFANVITKIGSIKDPYQRATEAQRAFGKGFASMSELMAMSADELKAKLASVSDQQVIDSAEVKKARDYRAAMDDLSDSLKQVELAAGEALVPALTKLAHSLSAVIEGGTTVSKSDLGHWMSRVVDEATPLDNMLSGLTDTFASGATGVDRFKGVVESLTAPLPIVGERTQDWAHDTLDLYDNLRQLVPAVTKTKEQIADEAVATAKATAATIELVDGVKVLQGALSDSDALTAYTQSLADLASANNVATWTNADVQASEQDKAKATAEATKATRDALDATLRYIATLGDIPEEMSTHVKALIDQGSLDQAQRELEIFARNLAASISIEAKAGPGYGPIAGRRAAGGPVGAGGTYLVGENGPELLSMGGGSGNITPNGKLGGAMHVTINMPVGSSGDDVVRAIQQWERRNGPGWRS